ncbi:efflux RND transporter periplasmic adaptor subunit [Mariniflexile sp.]|uniref:efflux RND transporter periplasmic adaptor subunit n=1 Tax=Mariniflexile sp. TaxID=1979402 RepID=UPI0035697F49
MNPYTLSFLSIMLFISCSCNGEKNYITPEVRNVSESVYASGIIKSKGQYNVLGKMNGVIEELFVIEGMQVKKGDPILKLDNKNLKLATENARLASTASDYAANLSKIKDAQKAITLAYKKFTNDSLLFQRQKRLWSQSIGSKVDFEQRALNFENSKMALSMAHTNYENLKRELKLVSDQSKNNLEIAKILEDDLIIRSEVDGVVYSINKEKGELINGSEPAVVIGTSDFIIELDIDEFDIVKIKSGQQVFIRMDSYKSQVFEAKIVAIDRLMNLRTRSFQAEAEFTKKPKELFPNLTVEANILINTKADALTIPRNYLVNDSTVRLKGGKFQKVATGLMDDDLVEIISGITKTTLLELPE